MWNCPNCNAEVDDKFDNCTQCGTGRDGAPPPVDFVKKGDAYQPGLPAVEDKDKSIHNKILAVLLVLGVIAFLLLLALQR